MKNLRYILTLSLILIVITTIYSTQSVLAEEGTGTITGRVTGLMKMQKSKELKEELKDYDIVKDGWFETETAYQNKVIFNKATVSIAGVETMTDENGLFILENVPTGKHILKLYDIELNLLSEKTIKVRAGKENKEDIELIYELGKGMSCYETNSEDANSFTFKKAVSTILDFFKVSEAHADYPCLDDNGGANCNSFFGSDCQYAMARGWCWFEHMPGSSSCIHGIHPNCSFVAGHPPYRHCH